MWPEHGQPLSLSPIGIAALLVMAVAALAAIARATLAWLVALTERDRLRVEDHLGVFEADFAPPVSILTRTRDEQDGVVERVRELLAQRYPALEVVVVNDGSSDATLASLTRAFGLRTVRRTRRSPVSTARVRGVYAAGGSVPLVVVDAERAGEAASLNLGLAFARYPLALPVSAAESLEPDTLTHLAAPFYEDSSVAAVTGVSRVGPRVGATFELPRRLFARFEALEALRGFGAGGPASGASARLLAPHEPPGLVARDEALAAGGYRTDCTSPRLDLAHRLRAQAADGRRGALRFVPSAVAWVEPASGLVTLTQARVERSRGGRRGAVALDRARGRRGGGTFAKLVEGAQFLAVEFAVPAIEFAIAGVVVAAIATGNADLAFIVMFVALAVVGGAVPALLGVALERVACPRFTGRDEVETMAVDSLVSVVFYRPLTTIWRLAGVWSVWMGARRLPHARTTAASPPASEATHQAA